jgi:hypothetical protein
MFIHVAVPADELEAIEREDDALPATVAAKSKGWWDPEPVE